MNEFEDRWMQGVKAARQATPAASDEAPFGFATRVIAQWQSQPEPSLNLLWQGIALRVLGAMAIILLSLAAYDALSMGDSSVQPPVENAVGDSLGIL
jgi:hypothetical protein